MTPPEAISVFIVIGTAIAMFFAAPIVMPVVPALGVILIISGVIFGLGALSNILTAYRR